MRSVTAAAFIGLVLAMAQASYATRWDIEVRDFAFRPDRILIQPGDTVWWESTALFAHTVTSDTGLFDSGNMFNGDFFARRFNEPGAYNYHCDYHAEMGMTGVINVEAVPEPASLGLLLAGVGLLALRRRAA